MSNYRNNHYVPQWYQKRFINNKDSNNYYYLTLNPRKIINNGHSYWKSNPLYTGPSKCFALKNLYTTYLGELENTDVEQYFFGEVDITGQKALEQIVNFNHGNFEVFHEHLNKFLHYLSLQRLRTPKGLLYLQKLINSKEQNDILYALQKLRALYCAYWAESAWCIADACDSATKFIISDHPITVYNGAFFPQSLYCRARGDPEVWFSGTHTIFPLNIDKVLILTNLCWARNPYGDPKQLRPNSVPFRDAIFDARQIQINRILTEEEVIALNFIIKQRAYKYIAGAEKEWLYPEKRISNKIWNKFQKTYLLMPDPRLIPYTTEVIIGDGKGKSTVFDAYGRTPNDLKYRKESFANEFDSSYAFKGEFSRKFGPGYRGMGYEQVKANKKKDTDNEYKFHLSLEKEYKSKLNNK